MQKVIQLSVLLILFSTSAFAQFFLKFEATSFYDNNIYRTVDKKGDVVSSTGMEAGFTFDSLRARIYYRPEYLFYDELVGRSFWDHTVGADYGVELDNDGTWALFTGANYRQRVNSDEYDVYNSSQWYGYATVRFLNSWANLKAGYNVWQRSYDNFKILNNMHHSFFVQFNKSLQTKTTLITESHLGYKLFTESYLYSTTEEGVITGRHYGNGKGQSGTMTYFTNTISEKIPNMDQFVFLGRVAQSLHPKVGIYLQYRRQISLSNTGYQNTILYYQDEELYDDPFSYQSSQYSSKLTWMLPWQVKMEMSGMRDEKNYIRENAYTSASDTLAMGNLRADTRQNLYIGFSKSLPLKINGLKSVTFKLDWLYIHNKSNSYWYNYENYLAGLSIEWILF